MREVQSPKKVEEAVPLFVYHKGSIEVLQWPLLLSLSKCEQVAQLLVGKFGNPALGGGDDIVA
jgi:hypothetical protein